ncbi:helix-turn-helix domain-containing protein [Ligilactobacillus aviarius]|uniref:helix-turn-helix domain-containing protein n=1 Tax=Ligilactobacillus aviarius TaxID=1606 RepID=UPI00255BC7C9|nr:helix-turn-helix transcriptional regulator [Ligilactobacillus aviarius]
MIRNRLSELLAERHLKISRVANDIEGLSRNTITATAQNKGKMIQLETIDKLCQYLGVEVSEFFEYVPFDIDVNCDKPGVMDLTSKDNFHNFVTTKVELSPFDMDLFLVKTVNSKDFGIQKKTYELTARISEPVSLTTYEEDDPLKGNYSGVEILFGQSESDDLSDTQEIFSKFISSLGNGFKEMVFNKISSKINKTINSALEDTNLPKITLFPRFTFNKFNENKKIENDIYLKDIQDNTNNSDDIDISDDELPF